MSALRLCLLLAPAALLASCGGDQPDEDDARSSSGEVLEGTISDAMLPMDTVRSQPPLLRPAPVGGASATEPAEEGEEAEGSAEEPAAADAAPTAAPPVAEGAAQEN